ncbi:YggS family pyridoxal phosphate-dependent enzyme [cyanobiont of Ornithocercus magnificus]|nr:YggS family pyridoxal phosphate-dependent enzyme [cyanobiont of Ornithocercus magnificus]
MLFSSSPIDYTMLSSRLQRLQRDLPSTTQLLAVSKGYPASAVAALAKAGQRDFGESRLQEALAKQKLLDVFPGLRWHFIGRLQSNKVRRVVRQFSTIHSLDSSELCERVSRIALEEKCQPKVLFQVKFRDDPNKGGWVPNSLRQAWPDLLRLAGIHPIGLMTICPQSLDESGRLDVFRDCRALADELLLPDCSMGMSSDWRLAVSEGATWIRLGSSLFSPRLAEVM